MPVPARLLHTPVMVTSGEDLPVLTIDGANFSDFDGFACEFSTLLCHHTWHGNLDAFNDILRGGFGTPEGGWMLRWHNSELSRVALGYPAMTRWLEQILVTCHPSNRADIRARIGDSKQGIGPTLFDKIVEIIRHHGVGGQESEDGVVLELM